MVAEFLKTLLMAEQHIQRCEPLIQRRRSSEGSAGGHATAEVFKTLQNISGSIRTVMSRQLALVAFSRAQEPVRVTASMPGHFEKKSTIASEALSCSTVGYLTFVRIIQPHPICEYERLYIGEYKSSWPTHSSYKSMREFPTIGVIRRNTLQVRKRQALLVLEDKEL